MKQFLLRILVAIFAFGLAAEAQVTTSSINGTINDALTKEELIGASVVAKHLPTGTVYGAATNAKGNFLIQGLRPGGPYTIEISYIGYRTTTIEKVMLSLGETETFNVNLQDDTQALQQVVVTGQNRSAQFNATRTGAGSSFNRTAIERTASVDRSLFDIAKLTPQAGIASNGAVSFAGSNNRYNSFQIDGAVSNDVFGLSSTGTNGGQSGTTPISIEAIDALQVVIAPYDVRQSGFTGGGINAITKSGTNTFSGSAYGFYKDQNFFGTTPGKDVENREKLGTQHEYTAGFTLGGALVKDKLFLFVNGEYNDETYPTRYLPGDPLQKITLDQANQMQQKFMDLTGGYNSGGFAQRDVPRRSYKALARLDWNISQAHRLSLRYSFLDATKLAFGNSANRLYFLSQGYTFTNRTHSIVGELNSRFSDKISNEFRASFNSVRDNRQIDAPAYPHIEVRMGSNRAYLGNDPYSAANSLDQDSFTFTDNLTFSLGDHTLVVGTHNEFYQMKNLFIPQYNGSYVFSTLEDFLSQGTATPARPNSYQYTTAIESVTGSKRYAPSFGAGQLGLYVQDEWKMTDLFRLTYGLRVDLPLYFDKPRTNDAFNSSAVALANGVRNDVMPSSKPLFSPRIGFRWHTDESRRNLIRGGAGIFTGRVPFVWIANSFAKTGVEFSETLLSGTRAFNNAIANGFAFSLDPNNQYISPGTTEVDMVTSNFKMPQTMRANLAFESMLPGDFKLTLEAMYNKTLNNIYYRNINQAPTGSVIDHGGVQRPLYSKVDNKYTYLLVLDNTSEGHSYSFTTQLSKDFNFGLSASLAYTFGESTAPIDGTSSIASSNWKYNYTFGGDRNLDLAFSSFDVRHRLVGSLSYRVEYLGFMATTIGLTYSGQSGSRFSLAYNGDINGDGESLNDLMYIPTDSEIDAMNFGTDAAKAASQRAAFKAFIAGEDQVAAYRGTYAPRNGLVSPFVHQFDLHFAQDFYLKIGQRRHTFQLIADVMNVGNLINRGWGIQRTAGYSQTPMRYSGGVYTFTPYTDREMWTINDIASRWKAQVGIKYTF